MSNANFKQNTLDPQFHHGKITELVDDLFFNNSVEELIDHLNETSGGYVANPQLDDYQLTKTNVSNILHKNAVLVRFLLLLSKRHGHLMLLNEKEVVHA